MTSPDSAYAVYYDEGPGYLFVADLSAGGHSQTMLVCSCAAPHNLYVRKRIPSQPNNKPNQEHHDEVSNYRQFKYIPKLIDWTSYSWYSFAMTMELCNGGSLLDFLGCLKENGHRHVPEVFIWKIFLQVLETLEFLHCRNNPPIVHRDLFCRNIFLHWPEDGRPDEDSRKDQWPDAFVGDFGLSISSEDSEALALDLRSLHTLLIQVCLCTTRRLSSSDHSRYRNDFPDCYSPELEQCINMLPEPWDGNYWPTKPVRAVSTSSLRQTIMPVALRKMAELQIKKGPKEDYRFTRPQLPTEVRLEDSKESLAGFELYEPCCVARVDRKTLAIIDIEEQYGFSRSVKSGTGVLHGSDR